MVCLSHSSVDRNLAVSSLVIMSIAGTCTILCEYLFSMLLCIYPKWNFLGYVLMLHKNAWFFIFMILVIWLLMVLIHTSIMTIANHHLKYRFVHLFFLLEKCLLNFFLLFQTDICLLWSYKHFLCLLGMIFKHCTDFLVLFIYHNVIFLIDTAIKCLL